LIKYVLNHQMEPNYWRGPYGIRVPNHIPSIKDSDGCNTLFKNGSATEMYNPNPPTKEQYLSRYAVLQSDGYYYWKEPVIPSAPTKLKVAIDVNLIDGRKDFARPIVIIEQMSSDNFQTLVAFECNDYQKAITSYSCDICQAHCNESNPIYTNSQHQGCGICTKCITKSYKVVRPMPGWDPGPVYSLESIVNFVKWGMIDTNPQPHKSYDEPEKEGDELVIQGHFVKLKKTVMNPQPTLPTDDMDMRDAEVEKRGDELVRQGHTCVYYRESYPRQLGWCGQTPCKQSQL
jgi:hypothetical protein